MSSQNPSSPPSSPPNFIWQGILYSNILAIIAFATAYTVAVLKAN